jgi:hypothetical protein
LIIEKLIKSGMEKGEFRPDLDAAIISFGILGVTSWSYRWFNPEGRLTSRKVAVIYVEMILKGIQNN